MKRKNDVSVDDLKEQSEAKELAQVIYKGFIENEGKKRKIRKRHFLF